MWNIKDGNNIYVHLTLLWCIFLVCTSLSEELQLLLELFIQEFFNRRKTGRKYRYFHCKLVYKYLYDPRNLCSLDSFETVIILSHLTTQKSIFCLAEFGKG